jgi:hypothetical protein
MAGTAPVSLAPQSTPTSEVAVDAGPPVDDPVNEPLSAQDAGITDSGDGGTPLAPAPAVPSSGCSLSPEERSTTFSASGHVFGLSFPREYDDNDVLPLLFGFHATGASGLGFITARTGAGASPFVDHYVIATPPADSGLGSWEYESSALFDEMYEVLETGTCFDTSRVFAIGHASGGRYLEQLACSHGGKLRAMALQGAMDLMRCSEPPLLPTIFIHSDYDSVATQYDEGDNSGAVESIATLNQCEGDAALNLAGTCESTSFECVDYPGCGAPFRACRHDLLIQGRDDWPCFANDEIFRFFSEHM